MEIKSIEEFYNGKWLLVDKPLEWTSFDVVNKIRGTIQRKAGRKIKVGHAGTLDPMATGLLLIATGKNTKKISEWQNKDKSYSGIMQWGVTTPSYDSETKPDKEFSVSHLSLPQIQQHAQIMTGKIEQVPPIYSALKIKGKKAYELARKGEEVNVKSRMIEIYKFTISNFDEQDAQSKFYIHCSKGTYIRSLIHDLARNLNCGAYLNSLRRESIGDLSINEASSIEDIISHIEKM